jgi:DNA-binding transcriptional LysR family regulator
MRGVEYAELKSFLAVAQHGSFRRAADALAVSPSAISHTLRALEDRLDARLLNRTTRSLSLTEAGRELQHRLAPAFAEIDQAVTALRRPAAHPSGLVRLTAPRLAMQMVLQPLLGRFLVACPHVRLEVVVDDALVDSVAEGFDAGVRLYERVGREMRAQLLGGPLRGIVVGSPGYFAAAGRPTTPKMLTQHRWLNYRQPSSGRLLPWDFSSSSGETLTLSEDGPLATNDPDLLIAAAVAGAGLAFVTETSVETHLSDGRLVKALDDWTQPFEGWTLYYPAARRTIPALQALIDFMASTTAALPPRREPQQSLSPASSSYGGSRSLRRRGTCTPP